MGAPINATTDPDSGLRFYEWNGTPLISVTSIRRVVGMPFALANWMVNQAVDAAVARTWGEGESIEDAKKALRKAATLQRDEAAKLGTSVHEAADLAVKAIDLPDEDPRKPFLLQYEQWQADLSPTIRMSERQVFSLKQGYAGSFDLIADIGKHRYLVDLKTGKGTYTDHAIQLALYMGADFIGGYDPLTDTDVIYPEDSAIFAECDRMAILHLRPEGYDFINIPFTDELAAAALDMVSVARFLRDHPTIDTLKGAI